MNQAIEYDARDSLLTNNSLLCLCSRPIIDHARGDRIPCQTGGFDAGQAVANLVRQGGDQVGFRAGQVLGAAERAGALLDQQD